jgi:hypothetical protein
MAKSKQQRQEEALARKRQNYNLQLERWKDYHPGGASYEKAVLKDGLEKTKKRMDWAHVNWVRYLIEAKLDPLGNPVTMSELEHLNSFLKSSAAINADSIGRAVASGPVISSYWG